MQPYSPAWMLMKRYVDDMLSVDTLKHLIPPKNAYQLDYSSVEVTNNVVWCGSNLLLHENTLLYEPFDKQRIIPFDMARYTHYRSMVKKEIFASIIAGAITRIRRFCVDDETAKIEIIVFITRLRERKYPTEFIKKVINKRIINEFGHLIDIPDEAYAQYARHKPRTQPLTEKIKREFISK